MKKDGSESRGKKRYLREDGMRKRRVPGSKTEKRERKNLITWGRIRQKKEGEKRSS